MIATYSPAAKRTAGYNGRKLIKQMPSSCWLSDKP
jgi:hypothetical protein